MRGVAYKSHLTGVPGWEQYDEQNLLFKYARELAGKKAVIVEIGGEFGMSASIFSKAAPDAAIYSVDIAFGGETGKIHAENLAEAGLGANVHQVAADSHKAETLEHLIKTVKEIDLLFLDGDHTYDGMLADLTLWTPFVKVGGKLLSHDNVNDKLPPPYVPHALHYEVSKAVAKWLSDNKDAWKQTEMVYSTIVFERQGIVTKQKDSWEPPKTTRGRPKK